MDRTMLDIPEASQRPAALIAAAILAWCPGDGDTSERMPPHPAIKPEKVAVWVLAHKVERMFSADPAAGCLPASDHEPSHCYEPLPNHGGFEYFVGATEVEDGDLGCDGYTGSTDSSVEAGLMPCEVDTHHRSIRITAVATDELPSIEEPRSEATDTERRYAIHTHPFLLRPIEIELFETFYALYVSDAVNDARGVAMDTPALERLMDPLQNELLARASSSRRAVRLTNPAFDTLWVLDRERAQIAVLRHGVEVEVKPGAYTMAARRKHGYRCKEFMWLLEIQPSHRDAARVRGVDPARFLARENPELVPCPSDSPRAR